MQGQEKKELHGAIWTQKYDKDTQGGEKLWQGHSLDSGIRSCGLWRAKKVWSLSNLNLNRDVSNEEKQQNFSYSQIH